MKDLVIFAGAPGSGKTTIGRILQSELNSPLIDFGDLRIWHLDRAWSNTSEKEEQMAFENLVFVLQNYLKHGYKNIIVNDLHNDKVEALTKIFKESDFIVIILIVNDDAVLKRRINGERDSGFKDVQKALQYNAELKTVSFDNEYKIDNTNIEANEAARQVLEIVKGA